MLFLATLLQRAGEARYFLELQERAIIPEPLGNEKSGSGEPVQAKSRVKVETIRGWFRHQFFVTRRLLANDKVPGHTIRFMGQEMKSTRQWKQNQSWALGKSLKWPFEKGHDPLLTDLHRIPLLSWQETRTLEKGEVYCPLDGPIALVKFDFISPPWTWEKLCGRHWRALLCPDCLGQFQVELVRMN